MSELNQKPISRMLRFAVLLYISLSPPFLGVGSVSVLVSRNGSDTETCLKGLTACQSLDYILQNLADIDDEQVDVDVQHDQEISTNIVTVPGNLLLNITGVNFPTITPSNGGEGAVSINGAAMQDLNKPQLHLSNIYFTNFQSGFSFSSLYVIRVQGCHFTSCGDLTVSDVDNVIFKGCRLANNQFVKSTLSVNYDLSVNGFPASDYTVEVSDTVFDSNAASKNKTSPISRSVSVLGVVVPRCPRRNSCSKTNVTVVVSNCSFTQTSFSTLPEDDKFGGFLSIPTAFSLDISRAVNSARVLVTQCTFSRNDARAIKIKGYKNEGQTSVLIQNTMIDKNTVALDEYANPGIVDVFFNAASLSSDLVVDVSNVSLCNNEGTGMKFTVLGLSEDCYDRSEDSYDRSITLANVSVTGNKGPSLKATCLNCARKMEMNVFQSTFAENRVPDFRMSTVSVDNYKLNAENCSFLNNTGTAARVVDTSISLSGLLEFNGNRGDKGGAIHVGEGVSLNPMVIKNLQSLSLVFKNNVALYGGALYMTPLFPFAGLCAFPSELSCTEETVQYDSNIATVAGEDMFWTNPGFSRCTRQLDQPEICGIIPLNGYASVASDFHFYNSTSGENVSVLSVFPGQDIIVSVSVKDAFGNPSTCPATAVLYCDEEYVVCGSELDNSMIKLDGPSEITLDDQHMIPSLRVLSPEGPLPVWPQILFQCARVPPVNFAINITGCPPGLKHNATAGECECVLPNSDIFQCSNVQGACIARGYWFGMVNSSNQSHNVVEPCDYSYCTTNFTQCPLNLPNSTGYILLPATEDLQCTGNHGGVLCKECADSACLSFLGSHCIESTSNETWKALALLVIAVSFQLILSLILMYFVRYTRSLGILFGPLFFIAVVNHFPFGHYPSLKQLKVITPLFSFYLLNLSAIGQIPWCFFVQLDYISNFTFQLLGPLISTIVMMTNIICAKRCPRLLKKLQITPLQALCLLAMLSFWTLAEWCIKILRFERFGNVNGDFVKLQPNLAYFTQHHIAMVVISLIFLAFFVVPFVLLLLLAPFVSKCNMNLSRIQPFLDVFQSSFKDRYRWCPAVYFIAWMLFLCTNEEGSTLLTSQPILVLIAISQVLIEPFQNKWINKINSVLFFDLVILDLYISGNDYSEGEAYDVKPSAQVVVYILTLTPLILITTALASLTLPRTLCVKIHKFLASSFRRKRKLVSLDEPDKQKLALEMETMTGRPLVRSDFGRLRESLLEST